MHNDDADCILIWSIQGLKAFECCRNDAVGPIADFGSGYDGKNRVRLDLDCEWMAREVVTTHGLKCVSVRTDPIADLITASVSLTLKSWRDSAVSVMMCRPCNMYLSMFVNESRESKFENLKPTGRSRFIAYEIARGQYEKIQDLEQHKQTREQSTCIREELALVFINY